MNIPEQGQLVLARNRYFLVQDVSYHQVAGDEERLHLVTLECLDDDRLGEELRVIWERESNAETFDTIGLPRPEKWDSFDRFMAFIHAVKWSTSSRLAQSQGIISAPFRSDVELEEYQLEPVARALMMPRVNLLIADDVGLGKTIEAGLVMQELIAQQRVRRVLVVCPASLQNQWREEMEEKFQLPFKIIDRAAIQQLRREYGVHVNPWSSYPRIITSMDFLKREQPLRMFTAAQKTGTSSLLREWNLLILDEAHNVAPSGRRNYVRDSERTKMARDIVKHFEHRLFLTATPHNGYTESFTALLELLDPLRFSRGLYVGDLSQLRVVLVRRLKDEILNALGSKAFAPRIVSLLTIEFDMGNKRDQEDMRLYQLLTEYTESRLEHAKGRDALPIRFTLTLLKKRLLSSTYGFGKTLGVHIDHLKSDGGDLALVERLHERSLEDWDDDSEKDQIEQDALAESSKFFSALTERERSMLEEMLGLSMSLASESDRKAERLFSWIDENMRPNGEWNDERLIIFTEYKDTLEYLHKLFIERGYSDRIQTLFGGMGLDVREMIKRDFQMHPSTNPVRILLSTDAASEGLNLQNHCRNLIHYEIPWNPNRLEQRNGRIDRHGQHADEVRIHHFLYKEPDDPEMLKQDRRARDFIFLRTVVDKVQRIRHDLGAVGEVIARKVEDAMLGSGDGDLDLSKLRERQEEVHKQLQADVLVKKRIREIESQIQRTRINLSLSGDNVARVLHEALIIQDSRRRGLQPIGEGELAGKGFSLPFLPPAWSDCRRAVTDDEGRYLKLVFDRSHGKDRKDTMYVHLNHPLMKRALGVFRKNMWSEKLHEEHRLNRVSYLVAADTELPNPVLVAYGRVVATGVQGQKLHESITTHAWRMKGGELFPEGLEILEPIIRRGHVMGSISRETMETLNRYFDAHEKIILDTFSLTREKDKVSIEALLKEAADKDAEDVKTLIKNRIDEITTRLKHFDVRQTTLGDFFEDEREQFLDDQHWLEERRNQLKEQVKEEPERVRRMLELRDVHVFPLGLLYLIPERLAGGDR